MYDLICRGSATVLVVSHDRTLLNLLSQTMELSGTGITVYGGNYDFYKEQKEVQLQALQERIEDKQKEVAIGEKDCPGSSRTSTEKRSAGRETEFAQRVPRIMMNTLKNRAENSSSKLKDVHTEKIGSIATSLSESRADIT